MVSILFMIFSLIMSLPFWYIYPLVVTDTVRFDWKVIKTYYGNTKILWVIAGLAMSCFLGTMMGLMGIVGLLILFVESMSRTDFLPSINLTMSELYNKLKKSDK